MHLRDINLWNPLAYSGGAKTFLRSGFRHFQPMLFESEHLATYRIEFAQAAEFVKKHHRHNKKVVGHKFSIGLFKDNVLVGVAVAGRPVSRHMDNGVTIEITRLCVIDGIKNGCSKLYSACVKTAERKGFQKVITYTLQSENGASLKASGFAVDKEKAGGLRWTGKRKFVTQSNELKTRWVIISKNRNYPICNPP